MIREQSPWEEKESTERKSKETEHEQSAPACTSVLHHDTQLQLVVRDRVGHGSPHPAEASWCCLRSQKDQLESTK